MNLQEIERLLEKYYNGETSLEEERRLKDFFSREEVPERLLAAKVHFDMLSSGKSLGIPDEGFEQAVLDKVGPKEGLLFRLMARRQWFYATAGVAASILILLAIFVKFDPFPKRIQDTYSDPEIAYQEAKRVLLFVSGQFNKGTDKLQPLATYDDGMNELRTVEALNDGIAAVGKIKKYNKIEQIIQETN